MWIFDRLWLAGDLWYSGRLLCVPLSWRAVNELKLRGLFDAEFVLFCQCDYLLPISAEMHLTCFYLFKL
jgi:hypothetical protein